MEEKTVMSMQLCSEKSCCPTVKVVARQGEEFVVIEDDSHGRVELRKEEWDILKELVRAGRL
jgi:hypothetical protein